MSFSRLLRTTALVVPFALSATAAGAADLVDTIEQTPNLETFGKAIQSAGMGEQLKGGGPFTIFAPSDEAFMRLPQSALEGLMQGKNQAELQSLLAQHVVEGKEIAASDVIGQQTKLSTLEGDQLTVDGTSEVVILVPTGLQITRVGDRVVVEREAAAVTTPSVEVRPAAGAGGQQQQQGGQQTPVTQGSDMPTTEHQQEVLKTDPEAEQQQTTEQASVPSTEHQRQVIRDGQQQEQAQQQAQEQQRTGQQSGQSQQQAVTAQQQTPVTRGSDMPTTEHQQEVLKADPDAEQEQTAEQASVPSTEHQRQVIRDGEQQEQAQQQPDQSEQQAQMSASEENPEAQASQQIAREARRTEQQEQPTAQREQGQQQAGQMRASEENPEAQASQQIAEQARRTGQQQGQARAQGDVERPAGQGVLREAEVIRPDIQADNGVIHVVDAVLVPQKVLSMLESGSTEGQQQPSQQGQQQKSAE